MTASADNTITSDEAAEIIKSVIGEGDRPAFASRPAELGDISLILRRDGGCEILSNVVVGLKDQKPLTPEEMQGVAMRGLVAVALYKIAHNTDMMAKVLTVVNREFQEQPPMPPKASMN